MLRGVFITIYEFAQYTYLMYLCTPKKIVTRVLATTLKTRIMNQNTSKASFSPIFVSLAALFCVCLIMSNIMEIKTVDLGWLTVTA